MKIVKPVPKYGFFLQPRQTGKTTRAVKEFLKRENCLFLTQNMRMREHTIKNFNIPEQYHRNIKSISEPISQFISQRWNSLIIDDIFDWGYRSRTIIEIIPTTIKNLNKTIVLSSNITLYSRLNEYFHIKLIENHLDN